MAPAAGSAPTDDAHPEGWEEFAAKSAKNGCLETTGTMVYAVRSKDVAKASRRAAGLGTTAAPGGVCGSLEKSNIQLPYQRATPQQRL